MPRNFWNRFLICIKSAKRSCLVFSMAAICGTSFAQTNEHKNFDGPHMFDQIDNHASAQTPAQVDNWWDKHVTNALRSQRQPLPADVHTLIFLALQHSNNIKVAKRDPLIRETAVQEADSAFDWVRYLDTAWNDTSQPVGNALTAGGTETRLNETIFTGTVGARKLTRYGGILDISQQFGWQDNNSIFLVPDNQATSQFSVSFTQPLLRGRGRAVNNSLVFLAQVDSAVAEREFQATLQEELLEITRNYWSLYLERATLTHQMRLFLKTQEIYKTLEARQGIDTQRTQLITAASALENRRSDMIRARTAVTNAETRLRGLINAPELANTDVAELIPAELPTVSIFPVDFQAEIQTAIQNRPEILAAIQQVKAGSIRLGVAEHELLPSLNLVTQTFANGLRGNSAFGGAFSDQFSTGRPSYSVGLQYELPVGNRFARARLCRRQHELSRMEDEYARALETVKTEVDIAVRELRTSFLEIRAKGRALTAAEAEATTIQARWIRLMDGRGTAALNLESLLRAQERVTEAERDYVSSVLTYNLGMVNLKRANGTLLQSESVDIAQDCKDGCKDIQLSKGSRQSDNPYGDGYVPTEAEIQTQPGQPLEGDGFSIARPEFEQPAGSQSK